MRIARGAPGQARGEHGRADVVIVVYLRCGLAWAGAKDPPSPLQCLGGIVDDLTGAGAIGDQAPVDGGDPGPDKEP